MAETAPARSDETKVTDPTIAAERPDPWEWTKCPIPILTSPEISPTALKVYLYLRWRAREKGFCFPHQETIATDANLSLSTVERAIRDLSNLGIIKITRTRRNQGNRYEIPSTKDWQEHWGEKGVIDNESNNGPNPQNEGSRPVKMRAVTPQNEGFLSKDKEEDTEEIDSALKAIGEENNKASNSLSKVKGTQSISLKEKLEKTLTSAGKKTDSAAGKKDKRQPRRMKHEFGITVGDAEDKTPTTKEVRAAFSKWHELATGNKFVWTEKARGQINRLAKRRGTDTVLPVITHVFNDYQEIVNKYRLSHIDAGTFVGYFNSFLSESEGSSKKHDPLANRRATYDSDYDDDEKEGFK